MRILRIEGDHYALGQAIGRQSRSCFERVIMPGDGFQRLLPWRDSDWMNQVADLTRTRMPLVWQELQGLADGCAQDLRDVLLWNCRGDILPTGPEGCSSLAVRRPDDVLIAHNEDGDPALREDCHILDVSLDTGTRFVCFAYPGSIPGHTLAANSHGLAYTVNNLRLVDRPVGLPRMVTARALLECHSAQEAIALLRNETRVGGFHFMMADTGERVPYSVEAPLHGVAATRVDTVGVHANHLVATAFSDVGQVITDSSRARQARLEALAATLPAAPGETDLLGILGDRADAPLPVFRDADDDPDQENTLATAVFRLGPQGIDAIIRDGPEGAVAHAAHFSGG